MRKQLNAGQFYGETLRRRRVGDLTLAEVEYQPHTHVPRHTHEHGYFCFVRCGHYIEEYSRHKQLCVQTMLGFHPPGESHAETFGDQSVASLNVDLGAEWLAKVRELGGAFDHPLALRTGAAAELGTQLFREFSSDDEDSDRAIESVTLEILASYIRPYQHATHARKPAWLCRAMELLDAFDARSVSLHALAAVAGVHPIHFAAVFRRFNGCSVGQYVRRRRIEHGRQLLANSDISLAEIALELGFADQSHFTRAYKRFTGRTPSEERTFLRFKTRLT